MASDWVFIAIGLLLLTHLGILIYAFRNRQRPATEQTQGGTGENVLCPDCGETNEPTYRYCRHCVTELPTRGPSLTNQQTNNSRRTM